MSSVLERLIEHTPNYGNAGCWRASDYKHTHDGYAQIRVGSVKDGTRRLQYVHCAGYECLVGPIPDGLEVDHVKSNGCLFRDCWNPEHLEPVTRRENIGRSGAVGALSISTGVCLRGHNILDSSNTYIDKFGYKHCKTCRVAGINSWQQAHKPRLAELARIRRHAER